MDKFGLRMSSGTRCTKCGSYFWAIPYVEGVELQSWGNAAKPFFRSPVSTSVRMSIQRPWIVNHCATIPFAFDALDSIRGAGVIVTFARVDQVDHDTGFVQRQALLNQPIGRNE